MVPVEPTSRAPSSCTSGVPPPSGAHVRVRRRADRVAAPLLAASQGPLQRPTLCIWYPDDPPEQRWSPGDGLLTLIEMTRVRLFKEGWYPRPPVQGRLVPRDWGAARRRDLTRTATRTRSPTARRPVRQPTLSHTALILHAVPGEARHRPRTTDRRGEGRRSNPLQTGLIPAPAARSAQTPHSRYE
jgi:hypothetical protein